MGWLPTVKHFWKYERDKHTDGQTPHDDNAQSEPCALQE